MDQTIQMTLEVTSREQADAVSAAWREIISNQADPRLTQPAEDLEEVRERGRIALRTIEEAIEQNRGTGQVRRLIQFLAGVYNGSDYPFDLTELRGLDTRLANACLDYLNYDRLGIREVHHHLSGGDKALHGWFKDIDLHPVPRLNDRRFEALVDLADRLNRGEEELLGEAVDALIQKYRK
jgi:hypothetical protein